MKRVLTAGLILASSLTFAQTVKVTTAGVALKAGRLDEAWQNIEEATKDPKTGVEPKTWKYRFDVLLGILQAKMDPKSKIEYKSLVANDKLGEELKASYAKVKELDPKEKYVNEIKDEVDGYYLLFRSGAGDAFNAATDLGLFKDTVAQIADMAVLKQKALKLKNGSAQAVKCLEGGTQAAASTCLEKSVKDYYLSAMGAFAQSYTFKELIGVTDSMSVFYAGVSAEYGGMKKEAVEFYKEAIKIKYNGAGVVLLAAKIEKDLGNTQNQINIIKEGRKSYPTDLDLMIEELNIYLSAENFVESEKLLTEATALSPNNESMFFALGSTYDNLANPVDKTTKKDLPKPANYNELVDKARKSYEKALEIKPAFFDALFNYGALLFNEGAELNNKANELDFKTKKTQMDELNKKANDKFNTAIPIFERALAIQPNDVGVLQSLKQLYYRMEMTAKYDEVNAKLKALK